MTNNDARRDIPVSPLGAKNMAHSLNHAPTKEEGKRIVRAAFKHQRMDRYMLHYAANNLRIRGRND